MSTTVHTLASPRRWFDWVTSERSRRDIGKLVQASLSDEALRERALSAIWPTVTPGFAQLHLVAATGHVRALTLWAQTALNQCAQANAMDAIALLNATFDRVYRARCDTHVTHRWQRFQLSRIETSIVNLSQHLMQQVATENAVIPIDG